MWYSNALNLKFPDRKKPVILLAVSAAILEIDDTGALLFEISAGISPFDGDTVSNEVIEFQIVLDERP